MSRRKRFTRNLGRALPEPAPRRTTVTWLRFEHETEPYGVFSYLSIARAALDAAACRELEELMGWFAAHLPAPAVGRSDARFWFTSDAGLFVERARAVAELVRRAGVPIVERRTSRVPGKATWADASQMAVLTYRDAPRPRRRVASR